MPISTCRQRTLAWEALVQEHGQVSRDQAMVVVQLARQAISCWRNREFPGRQGALGTRPYEQNLRSCDAFRRIGTDEAISRLKGEIHRIAKSCASITGSRGASFAHQRHLPGYTRVKRVAWGGVIGPAGKRRHHGDLEHHQHHIRFIVDVPEIRALIDEARRSRLDPDNGARVAALRPAFARLLAADGWLPDEFRRPITGRYGWRHWAVRALSSRRRSLCLFSLVSLRAPDARTRSLAWGLVGVIAVPARHHLRATGRRTQPEQRSFGATQQRYKPAISMCCCRPTATSIT